jgi:hypothetical protein
MNSGLPLLKLWNGLTKNMRVTNLSPDALIKKARRKTGLSDLGSDFDLEPLEVLYRAISEEADLNSFGQFMISQKLTNQLSSRLWATQWLKKYPEILEQEVHPIVLITGLQRTGTTKLQRLLSKVEGARSLKSWEALNPAPIGSPVEKSKRIKSTKLNERAVKYLSPGFYAIHPIDHSAPEEDVLLLDLAFMSTTSEAIMHVPSYAKWIEKNDQTAAYEYESKLMKLLQWQRPGSFWVLKSPHHLEFMMQHEKVFPNRKVVWTHREPTECIPSFLSMVYHSHAMFSDSPSTEKIREHWLRKVSRMLSHGINHHPVDTIHISFRDIMSDEKSVVHRITGETGSFEPVSAYKSRHKYSLADFDLSQADIKLKLEHYYKFAQENQIRL